MTKKKIFWLVATIAALAVTNVVLAAERLVPCGGQGQPQCTWPHIYVLIAKLINFALYGIAIPLSVIFVIWGGLKLILSQGSPGGVKAAQGTILSAVIGLAIALGAWVILSTVIQALCISSGGESKFTLKLWETIKQCETTTSGQLIQEPK